VGALLALAVVAVGVTALPAAAKDYPNVEIYRVVPGVSARNLTMNPALDTAPSPSPDGRRIAFVSTRDGQPDVYVISAAGGSVKRLTTSPFEGQIVAWNDAGATRIAWSPDGNRIAFDVQNATYAPDCEHNCVTWSVYVAKSDGSGAHVVATQARSPSWSRDGRLLAYEQDVTPFGESDGVAISKADGAVVRRLPGFNPDASVAPAWSPKRNELAFQSNGAVYTVRADGGGRHRLARGSNAAWSSDGSRLAFVRDGRIYRMTRTGTFFRAIGTTRHASFPVWSPDDSRIAFFAGGRVYVAPAAGGPARPVTTAPAGAGLDGASAWLRGSHAIVYAARVG
jgi:TolB protein